MPAALLPRKAPLPPTPYTLNRKLREPRSQCLSFGEEKNPLFPPKFGRFLCDVTHSVASRPTELSWLVSSMREDLIVTIKEAECGCVKLR